MESPVREIDNQADRGPAHETKPRQRRQAGHQAEARKNAQQRHPGHMGHVKGPRHRGVGRPQIDDRDADQDKGEQCADAHELAQDVDRRHGGDDRDKAADDELAYVRGPEPRMDPREQGRQKTVFRHRRENPALAVEQDEDDGGEPDQRAQLDEQREPFEADDAHALDYGVGHVQLGIRHQAGQHRSDGDVEDGRRRERAQDADRHVALRPPRLLRTVETASKPI